MSVFGGGGALTSKVLQLAPSRRVVTVVWKEDGRSSEVDDM